jgi:hypothetical protein
MSGFHVLSIVQFSSFCCSSLILAKKSLAVKKGERTEGP